MYLVLNQERETSRTAIVAFLFILDKCRRSSSHWLKLEAFIVHCLSSLVEGGACGCGFPLPVAQSSEK